MRKSIALAVILPAVLLAAAVAYPRMSMAVTRTETQSNQDADIPSPASWIPFSASFEKTKRSSLQTLGLFYRSSDGSTRSESGVSGQQWRRITIMNVALGTYFEQDRAGKWCSHPMRIDPKGHFPKKMRFTNAYVGSKPVELEGFVAYRMASASKVIQFVVPELNFFPLILDEPTTGTQQRYFNIRIGDQPIELFQLPPGVDVESHGDLMGIVHVGPNDPKPTLDDLRRHR